MYEIKILAHSASKKTVFASVTKQTGIFTSTIGVGSLALNIADLPAVGSIHSVDAKSITIESKLNKEGTKSFNWIVIN